MKIPTIKRLPKPSVRIRGRIAESHFSPCFCRETRKDGKPKKSCRICEGKGGMTDIWIEPVQK